MAIILGPLPCANCHEAVSVDRVAGQVRSVERRGKTFRKHRCSTPGPVVRSDVLIFKDGRRVFDHPRRLCDVWMPNAKERCARRAGHAGTIRYPDHRTRYALDNAARSRRTGWAA